MIHPLRVGFVIVWLAASAVAALAQADVVDRVVLAAIQKESFVGVAVGVVVDGRVVLAKGYGFADREAGATVDPTKSQFRWASCSKSVTAIAALQLVEAGKLDLDADVRTYVPEFPDKGAKITARQLLRHQAGIVHYSNGKVVRTEAKYDGPHPFDDVVVALDRFKASPLVNQPGEKYAYSTHGYVLLSAVVQRAGKERFQDQVNARIARPLGMISFQPDRQWEELAHRAAGYTKKGDAIVRRPVALDSDVSWKLGGGGYTSTVEDFAKFAAGLMAHKLVTDTTEKQMWTRQTLASGATSDPYGLGFALGTTRGGIRWVGHNGSQEKTRTAMLIDPVGRRAVVLMTNSEWANPTTHAAALLDALSGK